jgi:hypothetical protein
VLPYIDILGNAIDPKQLHVVTNHGDWRWEISWSTTKGLWSSTSAYPVATVGLSTSPESFSNSSLLGVKPT